MIGQLYLLRHPSTGLYYVGSSKHAVNRFKRHLRDLKLGKHANSRLQEAYNENQEVTLAILENFAEREQAYRAEERFINAHKNDPKMCNILLGGRGGDSYNRHPDKESIIANKSRAMKLVYETMSEDRRQERALMVKGKRNPMYGRTHTDEVKERLRVAHLGVPPANKGVPMNEHQRAKHREAIARIDRSGTKNSFYGRQHNDEVRAKLSEANKGKLPPNTLPVVIEGIVYVSCTEASRALGVPVPTVTYRVKSTNPKFARWTYKLECPETIETT